MAFRLHLRHRRHQVSSLLNGFIQPVLSYTPRPSTLVDGLSERLVIREHFVDLEVISGQGKVPIDLLPDDVLIKIFYFFLKIGIKRITKWHTLVHVCRRWRYIVSASPRHLGVQLVYTGKSPTSEMLDFWSVLPVVITDRPTLSLPPLLILDLGWRNIAAALDSEHNRTCKIDLASIPNSHWERIAAVMQKPSPELTHLRISVGDNTVAVVPDSFLGGSAPRLQMFALRNGSFPAMHKLLSSANNLVTLRLCDIPDSWHISPEAVATCLVTLTRLKTLCLQFKSPPSRSDPETRHLPPLSRSVLPSLIKLVFKGGHEYLEDLVSQIDAPRLHVLHISFFMNHHFNVPQLHWLINHAEKFKTFNRAMVYIFNHRIEFELCGTWAPHYQWRLALEIRHWELSPRLSSLAQFCSSSLTLIPRVEALSIREYPFQPSHWEGNIGGTQLLEFLDPFTAMKDLHLSNKTAPFVCDALAQLATERATEVVPALQNIFLDGFRPPVTAQKAIERFLLERRLSGHPVAFRS